MKKILTKLTMLVLRSRDCHIENCHKILGRGCHRD